MAIGWFGEDVVDWVGDRVSDAGDVFSSVAEVIPFTPELAGALKDVINGPLRDFARTPVGLAVFRAMTTTIYGPIAWTIGPQVASLVFALPGLARGDDFLEAYLTELKWRADETLKYVAPGASAKVTEDVQRATEKIVQMLPQEVRGLALNELARRLNVNAWTAAIARWGAAEIWGIADRAFDMPPRDRFDPMTGELRATQRAVANTSRAFTDVRSQQTSDAFRAVNPYESRFVDERANRTSVVARLFGGDSAPTPITVAAPEPAPRPRTSSAGNVALVGLIGLAGASLVWFYVGEKR